MSDIALPQSGVEGGSGRPDLERKSPRAMAANGSGQQWSTVRNIALAWVMTLPAAILLSGGLYALFRLVF